MISFAEARHIVEADVPGGVRTAAYGYESDVHWFPVPLPERIGGRVPAVAKATGVLSWVSSTTSDEYAQAQLCGGPRP